MKKACIITLYGNGNFGNKLQNYAVQKILENENLEVVTLINSNEGVVDVIPINKKEILINKFKNYVRKIYKIPYAKNILDKKKKFIEFNKKFMNYTDYLVTENNIPINLGEKFDYFIIGSDQVWNYTFCLPWNIMFPIFGDKSKNIAFAASLGVNDVTEKIYKEKYIECLDRIGNISVREEEGKKIIKELTGKKCEVVLDPTMIIDKKIWLELEMKPVGIIENEKYMLTYFLGKVSKERKKKLQNFSKKNNLKIIDLMNIKKSIYASGPSEFLYLINNASIVCTDSFHSCVFSILFNTSFYVFDREDSNKSMNSRIETLLRKFNLEKRKVSNNSNLSINCDFKGVQEVLKIEREKSLNFLRDALNSNKEKKIEK